MQLLPMAPSPDGLISARDAVITKTPGWGVLTTTRNVNVTQGHGWGYAHREADLVRSPMQWTTARVDPQRQIALFSTMVSLV